MRLCLVEDHAVAGLEPIALTRPAHELLLGASSLGAKAARAFGASAGGSGMVIRSHLAAIERGRSPSAAVNDGRWLGEGPVVVANARWVPPVGFTPPEASGPAVGLCQGEVAFARGGPGRAEGLNPHSVDDWFDAARSGQVVWPRPDKYSAK